MMQGVVAPNARRHASLKVIGAWLSPYSVKGGGVCQTRCWKHHRHWEIVCTGKGRARLTERTTDNPHGSHVEDVAGVGYRSDTSQPCEATEASDVRPSPVVLYVLRDHACSAGPAGFAQTESNLCDCCAGVPINSPRISPPREVHAWVSNPKKNSGKRRRA